MKTFRGWVREVQGWMAKHPVLAIVLLLSGWLVAVLLTWHLDNEIHFFVDVFLPLGATIGTIWAALAATHATLLTRKSLELTSISSHATKESLEHQIKRDNEAKAPFLRVTKVKLLGRQKMLVRFTNLSQNPLHIFSGKWISANENWVGVYLNITLSSSGEIELPIEIGPLYETDETGASKGYFEFLFYYGPTGSLVHHLRFAFSSDVATDMGRWLNCDLDGQSIYTTLPERFGSLGISVLEK